MNSRWWATLDGQLCGSKKEHPLGRINGDYTYSRDFLTCATCGLPELRYFWKNPANPPPQPFSCTICEMLSIPWKEKFLLELGHDGCYGC